MNKNMISMCSFFCCIRSMFSQEERDRSDVKKATEKERSAAPKMLAGLVALRIKAGHQDSYWLGGQSMVTLMLL